MSILSSNLLTLCPKCNNYPLLSLNKDHPKDILIQCDYCKYNQYTSLHNYLCQLNNNYHRKRNNNDNKCTIHNQKYNKYCVRCGLYLCNQCTHYCLYKVIIYMYVKNYFFYGLCLNMSTIPVCQAFQVYMHHH